MYPTSAEFKSAIRTNHVVVSRAEIWNQNSKILDLEIDSGNVTINVNSIIRRSCSVRLITNRTENNLVPDTGFDAITPFGNELRVYRGVRFDDGTEEYVPQGVFVMTDVKITDSNNGVLIEIIGEDKSLLVSRAKYTEVYTMVPGTLESSLTALLQDRYPDVETNFPTTNVSVQQIILGVNRDNNPWRDAVDIASLVGYDLFFDVNGVATMKQFPSLDGAAVVAAYQEGENTLITAIDRTMSTKETYNGIIYTVQGSKILTPIRVEVWDEDSTSPTYRYGVFGEAPIFIESNVIATSTEAVRAATLLLNAYIGAQEQITWNSIVDPSLDVNDVVYIHAIGSKVDRLVIIDSLNMPLNSKDALSAQARVVRVVDANEIVAVGA
jgi:hypothetical protein